MATRKKLPRHVPESFTIKGERLLEARLKEGLSQLAAARKADVSPPMWSLLETNKYGEVKTGSLVRISRAVRASIDWLLGESENPKIR